MVTEREKRLYESIPEDRRGEVRDFGEMKHLLPNSLTEGDLNFLKDYFRMQKRIKEERMTKAREINDGLKKRVGWREFADEKADLLVMIDIAVTGSTQEFLEPVFQATRSPKRI